MKKILQSPRRIKFSDCDPMGHLYNAKYIQYLLDAREDQVESAFDFNPIDYVKKTGLGWIVVQNQIGYLKAAIFNETVICQSFIRNFNARILEIECSMWDVEHKIAKTLLWTRFLFMDTKNHVVGAHPPDILELFGKAVVPVEQKTFEERMAHFRKLNKTS